MLLTEDENKNVDRARGIYGRIREVANGAEQLINEIVLDYSKQLDDFVDTVERMLEEIRSGDRKDFDDKTLHRLVMRLPILMYRMVEIVDRSAIESDVAKAAAKLTYSQHYVKAEGTIPERESIARLLTADEEQVVDLSRHVHTRLKGKLDKAEALFDAVRKIVTSRDNDKNVFGRSRA